MRNDTEEPRRGRPPAYDRDRALGAIRDAFWKTGLAATSLDDLAAAAGMNRPSLYGAFGDKRAMYLAAMALFSAELGGAIRKALAAPKLDDALAAFYAAIIEVHLSGGARGCFVSGTAPVEALQDPVVRDALAAVFADLDAGLASRLRKAQADGEIAANADPVMLGKIAAAVVHSLALRARAGASRGELEAMADQARCLIAA
jgi:AcrR family transcriptional regulator